MLLVSFKSTVLKTFFRFRKRTFRSLNLFFMRIKHKSALSLILFAASCCTLSAQESETQAWEQNRNITGLTKIELGKWTVPDTVVNQWRDKDGNTTFHNYPSCYLLDLKEESDDVTPGKSYVLKDMAEMFGPDGLLKDAHDNLDRLMQSPLMSATRLVYTAKGGPVGVDYMFGSGGFGNRLCYFYVPADSKIDETTLSIAQALANNKIPTFCIADQMRTSIYMDRFEKQNGEWTKIDGKVGNSDLGDKLKDATDNYGGWGDNLITGKRFRLKYFGDDYTAEPTDDFPAGTRIYFFLATYNDYGWNGVASEGEPYSIKFAYRQLNREFGSQGKWDYMNIPKHKEKYDTYGPGIFAAAAVNFTYTDSDKGSLENVQFLTWEDYVQPDKDNKVGDFDMGDVGFGLYGVNNPLFDVISESTIQLQAIQEAKDYQDQFFGSKGALKNAYRYKFILTNGDENGENKVYSRGLQPVTFTQDNADTGEGHFNPSYTWASIRRFTDDSEVGEVVKYVVIKKSATLPDGALPKVGDLNNAALVYRIEYAMTDTYDETSVPENWDGTWYIDGEQKSYFEHRRGEENDKTALPLEKMTSLYHDAVETLNSEGRYINSKRFWMMFAFRDGIRVRTGESAVASPRAKVVIEPRGAANAIDLDGSETKHLESPDALAPVDNRTFFTLTYNPQTELYGKEHISALFIVNEEGKRFCKIRYDETNAKWVTEVESSDHADNQNPAFEILNVIDESATCRHFVLSTNLAPDKKFGVMVETQRDLSFEGIGIPDIDFNTFGGYPAECQMPTLSFDKADLSKNGVCEHDGKQSYVMYVNTEWSLKGASVPGRPVFSQWRTYNNPAYPWDNKESAYLNILYDNQAATGTIPAEAYENWLGNYDNELIATGDGSWKNHDIIAQLNEGVTDVNGEYVLRAYFPSVPAILAKLMKAKAAEAPENTSYVVLEAKKPFNAVRNELTTVIETITTDTDAPAEYYNLRGQRVVVPAAGELYIVRRGSQVSKEIVR